MGVPLDRGTIIGSIQNDAKMLTHGWKHTCGVAQTSITVMCRLATAIDQQVNPINIGVTRTWISSIAYLGRSKVG